MDTQKNFSQIFDALVELYKSYSLVHRRNLSYDKYAVLGNMGLLKSQRIAPDQPVVCESLLEHVGNLPLVATFLYPHLEQRDSINLGRVLTMLAIHDIGETIVGDGHPHRKTQGETEAEYKAALSLLSESYHKLLAEYKAWETLDARYAKAVDVFSTFLSDQLQPPKMVQTRLKIHGFSWQEVEKKRYEVFEGDAFLKGLFSEVIKRYQGIESKAGA